MAFNFEIFMLLHVPRDQNKQADLLAKLASTQKRGQQKSVIHESLSTPTIDRQEVWGIEGRGIWMGPFLAYLKEDQLPEDPGEAKKIAREASKCVDREEAADIIQEVHEGVCGTHIEGRALASKFPGPDITSRL
ncbi:hypothetical protein CR513_22283, partial [Mucuna pruriens]